MNYWLVKTDPETYSWDDFAKDKSTSWDGVRNYAARLHMRAMKKGDQVLIYHSGGESEIRGMATVSKEFYPDPTSDDESWISVGLKAGRKFKNFVTLKQIKMQPSLKDMALIKISRLSVMPVKEEEFKMILEMEMNER